MWLITGIFQYIFGAGGTFFLPYYPAHFSEQSKWYTVLSCGELRRVCLHFCWYKVFISGFCVIWFGMWFERKQPFVKRSIVWRAQTHCEGDNCLSQRTSWISRFLTLQLSTLQLLLESAPNWHLQPQAQTALIHISWVNHYGFSHRVSKPGTGTSWKVSFPSSNKSLFNSYTTIKEQVMHNNNNIYILYYIF